MSFQKIKTDSFCVGGRHRYITKNIYGDIRSKRSKVLIGYCSICKRKKSMTVCENTIQVEGLGDFFEKVGEKRLNVTIKMAKNFLENPGRALEIGANAGSAFVYRSPKAALSSLPEVINFYQTGKGLYLLKFF